MNSNKWLQNNNIYRLGDDYTIEHSTLPIYSEYQEDKFYNK